jgi:hypothetical protein
MSDTTQQIDMRLCLCCKIEKPVTEFYERKKSRCKDCICAKMRQYRESDKVKEHARKYSQSSEVKAKGKTAEAKNRTSARKKWAEGMYKILNLKDTDY